jgi:uncharacterized protein YfaS (alpha-2-macroglobulin family)
MSKHDENYDWGSQPVGGSCTSAAQEPIHSIGNMVERLQDRLQDRLKQVDDLHEDNVRREVSNALSRAEEQGYRVGYDAAMESCRTTLAELEARVKNSDAQEIMQQRAMKLATETIRHQNNLIRDLQTQRNNCFGR